MPDPFFPRLARVMFLLVAVFVAPLAGATTWISNSSCVEAVYVVPPAITKLHVTAIGAQGENGTSDNTEGNHNGRGGKGGYGTRAIATFNVVPGQSLYVGVADQYNGSAPLASGFGGAPGLGVNIGPTNIAGPGGAMTFITANDPRVNGCKPGNASPLLIAAGGGGGGGAASFANGGDGGTETVAGGAGFAGGNNRRDDGGPGLGATIVAGGAGGAPGSSPTCISGTVGTVGGSAQGGRGGDGGSSPGGTTGCQPASARAGTGAGGGAGFFGGGGGGGGSDNSGAQAAAGGGGGAGASFFNAGFVSLDQPLQRACIGFCTLPDEAIVSIVPFDTNPAIVSGNAFTFTVGTPVNTTLTAGGWPVPQISIANLPAGVLQQDNGDGTLSLTGTPQFYAGGVYAATVVAGNTDSGGVYHATSQSVTITVRAPARFANPSLQSFFEVGVAGSFGVVCNYAYPQPTLSLSGTVPPGLALVDNGDCTGQIAGTPTVGGVYNVTLNAANGVGAPVTQAIRVQVTPIPFTVTVGSTQNPSAPGQAVSFTAQLSPIPDLDDPYIEFKVDGVQFGPFLQTNGGGFTQTAQATNLASGPHVVTARVLPGGIYGTGIGQLTQQVSVASGPASGTTLTVTPATQEVFVQNGRVYNVTLGGLDVGISAVGTGLAIDSTGNTYTFGQDSGNTRLRRTTPAGVSTFFGPTSFNGGVFGLGVDGQGNVFGVQGPRIVRVDAGGGASVVLSGSGYVLRECAVDSAGNAFAINYTGSESEVLQVSPPYNGEPTRVATGLAQAGGLAVDAADNLFVSDTVANAIYRYSLITGQRTTVLTGLPASKLAIDADNTLYFVASDVVYKLPAPYTGVPLAIDNRDAFAIATRARASAPFGQPVMLKANVVSGPAGAFPAGTVTFRDGATVIGTQTLASGTATLGTSSLALGTHVLTASYNGSASFPASTGAREATITLSPVPVTVTGTRVRGSATATFAYTVGTLPPGITGVAGTLTGCTSSTSPGAPVGTYQNTIFGCGGLTPTGPNAASFAVQYLDGGVAVTPQPLAIVVAGRSVLGSGVVTYTWTTPITLPTGTTIAGSLGGCASTVNAASPLGTYNGTITGCGGLSVTGPAAADYLLGYVDAGVEVVPLSIAVTVTATKPFGGGVSPTFSYTPPATLPGGVTGIAGALAGCTSSVVPTTPVGTYNGTITGCGGLSAQGPQGASFSILYVDGGLTVTPRGVAVQVYGSRLPGGTNLFRYSIAGGFPRDIVGSAGKVTGCTTTVAAAAPPGTYTGTIGGCTGLQVFTSNGVVYAVSYVDAGFVVGNGATSTAIAPTTAVDPDLLVVSSPSRLLYLQPPPYTQAPAQLPGPQAGAVTGSAFDSRGNLLATDFNALYVFDPAGTLRRVVPLPFPLDRIALDSQDNVFGIVADGNTRAAIWRLDYPYTKAPTLVLEGFGGVSALFFDGSDRLYIGDQFARYATMLDPPYTGPASIVADAGLASGGFTVDAAGNLFLGINGNGPPGTPSRTEKSVPPYTAIPQNFTGDVFATSFGPAVLAADRQGNLFGTDQLGLFRIPSTGGLPVRLNAAIQSQQVAQSNPPATAAVGGSISVTVTVASTAGGTPAGTVQVLEGATLRASGPLVGGKATLSIPGLAEGTHFLTASYVGAAPYNASASGSMRAVVGRASPTILFTTPPPLANGASAAVTAVATSALPVTYSSTSPACGVTSAGVVTGLAVGDCTITATAAGNGTFLPALPTTITLPIAKGSQAIAFGAAPSVRVGTSASVSATASSGLTVTFASTNSTCTVTPAGLVTGVSVGPCDVTATQAGNANYNAAPPAVQTLAIAQGTQAIAFGTLPAVGVGTSGTVSATGGGSFNPVVFASASGACAVGATGGVDGLHAGNCVIDATQAGNTNWQPATASTTLAIAQGTQVVTFAAPTAVLVGGNGNVSATSTSGLAVTYSTTSANCSVTPAGVVSGLHGGTCAIAGNQAGNADYAAAPTATLVLDIGRASQSIAFGSAPAVVVGGTGNVSATGGASGNAVAFATTSSTCTVTPTGTVTGVLAGPCLVTATQAGNADYAAATPATQTLAIARGPQAITFGTAPTVEVLGTGTVTATTPGALPVSFSTASASCTVTPAGVVSGTAAGTCIVDAVQPGDPNWLPAPPASQSVPITLVVRPTDLAVAIDDGTAGTHLIASGRVIDYTIVAANLGANAARAARVDDVLPANLTGAGWACEVPFTGTCTLGGTGDMHALATIPPGGDIVFHVTATVAPLPEQFSNTATVATGVTETDGATANNSATVATRAIVFANGFEGQGTLAPVRIDVALHEARTEVLMLDLSSLPASEAPQLAATIADTASARGAQLFVRNEGMPAVRLSWRGDDGRWRAGAWVPLAGGAPVAIAWSTGAEGKLAEVNVAEGATLLAGAGPP